jgi:hypothetical protein
MDQLPLIQLPDIVTIQAANNHLKKSGDRCYTLRFTVTQGPKFTGKRISVSLGTKDLVLAERVRAISLESLKKAGFRCDEIKLGQPTEGNDSLALRDCIMLILNDTEEGEMKERLQAAIDATS